MNLCASAEFTNGLTGQTGLLIHLEHTLFLNVHHEGTTVRSLVWQSVRLLTGNFVGTGSSHSLQVHSWVQQRHYFYKL